MEEHRETPSSADDAQPGSDATMKHPEEDQGLPVIEQPETPNIQPENYEEMEVHHHTHASHGKKNWKNYFWEFLMLFLAVFCGFLA